MYPIRGEVVLQTVNQMHGVNANVCPSRPLALQRTSCRRDREASGSMVGPACGR